MALKTLMGILLILYPAVVYYGLTNGMTWLGLLLLVLFFIYKSLFVAKKRWHSVIIVCMLSLGAWLLQATTVKLIPIVIHVSLFLVFYQSLRVKKPIIERFARLDFPAFPEGMAKHCWQITQVWVFFFLFNIIFNIILVTWASDELWAIYNGVLVYGFIGLLVIGEYIWRSIKFPDLIMPSFKETVLRISKNSRGIIGNAND